MTSGSGREDSAAAHLAARIEDRTATVGIIGLGYVGLPLAHAIHSSDLAVLGFDVDTKKIQSLAAGRNYLQHLGDALTRELADSTRFEATTDFNRLGEADIIVVCVPTPLGKHREPDLSYVLSTAELIGQTLRRGQLLVLESTTYPGTTREQFLPTVASKAKSRGIELTPGADFFVAYSPEREDPGRSTHTTTSIPKVVGGIDKESTQLAAALYRTCIQTVRTVNTAEVAEASKLLENIFRAVNIALINEIKVILEAMGINVWEVVEAAATKPFGFMPFYPGPGLGGHCIPIDPFYLSWKAKEVGKTTRFIELAGEINTEMPSYVISQLTSALNRIKKPLNGARILVLGLAYKPDVNDTRESPSFELIERLSGMGSTVDYSDPHISKTVPVRKHDLQMTSVELTPSSIRSYDAIVIATAHNAFDYNLLAREANLVIDTRNAMGAFAETMHDRLVRA